MKIIKIKRIMEKGFGKPFYVKSKNKFYEWYKNNPNFKIIYEKEL